MTGCSGSTFGASSWNRDLRFLKHVHLTGNPVVHKFPVLSNKHLFSLEFTCQIVLQALPCTSARRRLPRRRLCSGAFCPKLSCEPACRMFRRCSTRRCATTRHGCVPSC